MEIPSTSTVNFTSSFGALEQAISILLGVRTIEWATLAQPLHKQLPNRWSKKSKPEPRDPLISALDLCISLRGIDWVPKGDELQIHPQPRSTTIRKLYTLQTIQSLLIRFVLLDICHAFIIYSYPGTMGLPEGGSIYDCDPSYSPFLRLARATFLGTCTGVLVLSILNIQYDAPALLFVALGGQDPNHWTPVFGSVWTSTSLTQLWNDR